ncbi:MAG: DUF5519 family protein [Solirubrobacterales bacterium]|nr:DUF5519 family protein [Solirubrobacterales bacterium]MBV9715984.1 DUF5519 family protein [Solirubrobacterales bacterium]
MSKGVNRELNRTPASVADRIVAEVGSWPEVEIAPHRFGGVEFRLGRRELGHLHGDRIADLPFPRRVRDQLVAAGRARPHHVLPDSGWVTFPIGGGDGVEPAIELFRLAYERARSARSRGAHARIPGSERGGDAQGGDSPV